MKISITLLIVILLFMLSHPIQSLSQESANQIIMNPHVNPFSSIGQTLGGASIALADSVPIIIKNPANIAQLKSITAFLGVNYTRNYIDYYSSDFTEIPKQQNDDFSVNIFAFSVPFHIADVPITVGASYTADQAYYYEVNNIDALDDFSAQLYLASIGLALQPSQKLRLGFGYTRLLSKYQHRSVNQETDNCSSNDTDYSANIYYIGLQNDPNESLSWGLTLYLPFDLKANNTTSNLFGEEQEYSTSLKFGLGYHLNDSWTFGIGYSYQYLKAYESSLSILSAGIGYTFFWDKNSVPLYLMYETLLFPQNLNESVANYGENVFNYHLLGVGGGIQYPSFSLYVASTWSLFGDLYYTSSSISPVPPWS